MPRSEFEIPPEAGSGTSTHNIDTLRWLQGASGPSDTTRGIAAPQDSGTIEVPALPQFQNSNCDFVTGNQSTVTVDDLMNTLKGGAEHPERSANHNQPANDCHHGTEQTNQTPEGPPAYQKKDKHDNLTLAPSVRLSVA